MSKKLDKSIYDIPEVKRACERAQTRRYNTDEEQEVWVDPENPQRIFTVAAGESMYPLVCVFSTADGGRLI